MFGVKRGRSLSDARCTRYEARPMGSNHCGMAGGTDALNCVRCGHGPQQHEDLGAWADGEPMLVTESGQRFKTLRAQS